MQSGAVDINNIHTEISCINDQLITILSIFEELKKEDVKLAANITRLDELINMLNSHVFKNQSDIKSLFTYLSGLIAANFGIEGLNNVTNVNLADGNLLVWNASSNIWEPSGTTGAPIASIAAPQTFVVKNVGTSNYNIYYDTGAAGTVIDPKWKKNLDTHANDLYVKDKLII